MKLWISLLAALLLAGCSCHAKVGNIHPARELVQYRPKSPDAKIDAVSFGTSFTNNFDDSKVGTKLPAGTPRALVWYQWHDADSGRKVQVHWFKGQTLIHQEEETLGQASGESSWSLNAKAGPLPPGDYHVDLLENGQVVTTIPFTVGQ